MGSQGSGLKPMVDSTRPVYRRATAGSARDPFALRARRASGSVERPPVHGALVIKKPAVLLLILAFAVSACAKEADKAPAQAVAPGALPAASQAQGGPEPAAGAASAAPAVKPVPAQIPDVVARVNGEDVKKAEFEMAIKSIEDRARSAVPAEQRDQVYRQVLDRLIGFHLLVRRRRPARWSRHPGRWTTRWSRSSNSSRARTRSSRCCRPEA